MKQGSTDDPFADDPEEPEDESSTETKHETESEATMSETQQTQQQHSLPYIHARESVKEGREQKPIFLREPEVVEDLVDEMEERIGEDVYKTDVLEAAILAAKSNPENLEDELREWGYGWS